MLDAVHVDQELLEQQQREFDEFGYLILQDVLPQTKVDQLLEVIEEIRPILETHEQRNTVRGGLNIRPVIDKHPAFMELLIWPGSFAAVVKLLGHSSIQLMQSNLIEADPSTENRVTGWHNDGGVPTIAVNGIRAFGSLKVGYFLRDVMDQNMGSLMVVPGSHRMQGAPPFPRHAVDPVGAVQLKLKAGDAVVFHQGLWHAAAPNLSAQRRVALYYGYGYRVLRPVDYQRMPPHVLADCTPIERQLLGETVTHQGYYLPTDADTPLRPWFEKHFGASTDRGNLDRVGNVKLNP